MELTAALEAVRSLGVGSEAGPVTLVSDSTYVLNCFRNRWYVGWQRNGWRNSQRKPVANRDLWEPLIELVVPAVDAGTLTLQWVKGHSGDPMNDLVDRLAVQAVPR